MKERRLQVLAGPRVKFMSYVEFNAVPPTCLTMHDG